MSFETWISFVIFCLVITTAPGPGNILTINNALQHGWRPSRILILGQEVAVFILMLSVTLGTKFLSNLTYAMMVIKVLGTFWLLYSAWSTWNSPFNDLPLDKIPMSSKLERFTKGFITDFTNGKAWVFFIAMVPAYLNMSRDLIPQSLILSFTLVFIDSIVLLIYAIISGKLRELFSSPKIIKIQNRISAVIFILLALKISIF
ncbi:LysE family translocator [Candidatus Liberibacter brunswickensis]|uniref:LysE family translocator n=1 Tax=Candidatus Liberibacter brunswickensis TaxID=1968796 RepID=UPI002FE38A55